MATGGTTRKLTIDSRRDNPGMGNLITAFSNAFDRHTPGSVTFSVTEGSRETTVRVQIIGLEYESGNPNRLNFKGQAEINGREQRISGFYAADKVRGYIDIPAT